MKRVLFLALLTSMAFANSLLDEYRKEGIEKIERRLDRELAKQKYWQDMIEKADTKFGYTQNYTSILICDKNSSKLQLYQKDANAMFVLKNEYKAFTGKNKGDKQNEGDLKTPVGIYTLVKKLSKVDSFYGPFAFVTSYPNLFDRYRNKKGHGIWIHGLPIDQKRDSFTKGCIAIDNDGLECLSEEIELPKTLLLIYETKNIDTISKQKLSRLAAWLYRWRYAWKYNDIDGYLDFYADDFKRFDGKNKKEFARFKKAIFSRNEKKKIIFDDISIFPYPNNPGIYQITFFERYQSEHYRFEGPKELLVKENGSRFEIFSEK